MKSLTYNRRELVVDLARALSGLILTGGIMIFLDPLTWIWAILLPCFALFTAFLLQTGKKAAIVVTVDPDCICQNIVLGPVSFRSRLAWTDLADVKLRYFSTKRKSRDGWMQLTLKAPGKRFTLDSNLDDFDLIAKQAGALIKEKDLDPDQITRENFLTFGVRLYDID